MSRFNRWWNAADKVECLIVAVAIVFVVYVLVRMA